LGILWEILPLLVEDRIAQGQGQRDVCCFCISAAMLVWVLLVFLGLGSCSHPCAVSRGDSPLAAPPKCLSIANLSSTGCFHGDHSWASLHGYSGTLAVGWGDAADGWGYQVSLTQVVCGAAGHGPAGWGQQQIGDVRSWVTAGGQFITAASFRAQSISSQLSRRPAVSLRGYGLKPSPINHLAPDISLCVATCHAVQCEQCPITMQLGMSVGGQGISGTRPPPSITDRYFISLWLMPCECAPAQCDLHQTHKPYCTTTARREAAHSHPCTDA